MACNVILFESDIGSVYDNKLLFSSYEFEFKLMMLIFSQ